jgi:hypothetical protein
LVDFYPLRSESSCVSGCAGGTSLFR